LLLATNAYHRPTSGARVPPLTPVNFFQLATAPLSPNVAGSILPRGEGAWDTGLIMTSYRKDAAGRLILGAMGKPDAVGLHRAWAERALARLFPQAAGAELAHFWSGRIGMTGDKIPKIQRLGPGGLAVFGYSGRGIAPGTVLGRACARALLAGTETDLPLPPVDRHDESWTALRGAYFETGARLLHGLGARF
jgi:glycine/D-amino acid oxidase-like deaminating enzyme